MDWQWSRANPKDLVRYVNRNAANLVRLAENRYDLTQKSEGRRQLIEAIYNALVNREKKVRYALEPYHPSKAIQPIRTSPEVLDTPGVGTCLDLAILFCGLCLGNELLPLLIVLENHALVAVSLTHGLQGWDAPDRRETELFRNEEPLTDIEQLRELIDSDIYLALECTGFAQSESLSKSETDGAGRINGLLPFDRAVAAGREQLDRPDRPLRYAFDIAIAHYGWRIEPLEFPKTDIRYIPEIDEVTSPNSTASRDVEVISPPPSPPTLSTFEFEVLTVNAQGQEIRRCSKQAQYFIESLGGAVELEMVSIPGGKFQMGAPKEEEASQEDERPQHLVAVKPFFMGRYPITQAQWRAIATLPEIKRELNPDPSCFKGDNLPVERVSWYEAMEFCERLSKKTGREYRLPSEAEWEYACRARTSTPFHYGATITTNLVNYCGQDRKRRGRFFKGTYARESNGVFQKETTQVGNFPANAFGLHDMHGNVREWCADYRHEDYQGAPSDGSVWLTNGDEAYRILRGGLWNSPPSICRSACRSLDNPSNSNNQIGFRVVCSFA